jgi:hypothetical protein
MSNSDDLKKVVGFAIENEEFRKALTSNAKDAIDSRAKELGFDYSQLPQESQDVLSSFTVEELNTLGTIYLRAKSSNTPIDPVEMF